MVNVLYVPLVGIGVINYTDMGLIDFLEGAYKGGRLLFLLYDHEKQVKLRYKAIKGSGVKRLPSPSSVIVSESIKRAEKQALVYPQSNYSTRDTLEEEIKISLAQGFRVTVRNDYIDVWCLRTGSSEVRIITDHVETLTKLSMIKQMKDNLIKQRVLLRRPLPSNDITPHYDDIIGGTFGFVGGLATSACKSLIKGANARKKQELTQNLNRYER